MSNCLKASDVKPIQGKLVLAGIFAGIEIRKFKGVDFSTPLNYLRESIDSLKIESLKTNRLP